MPHRKTLISLALLLTAALPTRASAEPWQPPPADVVLRVRYASPLAHDELQVRGDGVFRREFTTAVNLDANTPELRVQQGRLPLTVLKRFAKSARALCQVPPYRDTAVHGQTLVAVRIAPGPACVVRLNGRAAQQPQAGLRALAILLDAVQATPETPASPLAVAPPLADVLGPMRGGAAASLLRVAWLQGGWQVGEVDAATSGAIAERTVFDAGFACAPMPAETVAELQGLLTAAMPALCEARALPKKGLQIAILPGSAPPGCQPQPLDLPTLLSDPRRAALWQALQLGVLRTCPLDALLFSRTLAPIPLGLPPHRD